MNTDIAPGMRIPVFYFEKEGLFPPYIDIFGHGSKLRIIMRDWPDQNRAPGYVNGISMDFATARKLADALHNFLTAHPEKDNYPHDA